VHFLWKGNTLEFFFEQMIQRKRAVGGCACAFVSGFACLRPANA
jgi:hypothetical protein